MRAHLAWTATAIASIILFYTQLRHPFLRLSFSPANEALGWTLALALPWWANAMVQKPVEPVPNSFATVVAQPAEATR